MIIVRSPLRISLGGGGTDVPSYYREFGGSLLAAAIDKYVYIILHPTFKDGLILKYSQMERVDKVDQIQHRLFRQAFEMLGIDQLKLEIASLADIPDGTGLGSSGSFTTALLKALHAYKKDLVHPRKLAEEASCIEIDRLKEPVGKQDTYIAAYGGLTHFTFKKDDHVEARPLRIAKATLHELEDMLLLFFTGFTRSAGDFLKDQDVRSRDKDAVMLDNLHAVKELGEQSLKSLESGDLHRFAELMNAQWDHKKRRSKGITRPEIDHWYQVGLNNGAVGGKLVGAGGGGFLMFYAEDRARLRKAMADAGLEEVRFRFDFEGTKTLVHDA
jgi:D-glycero-alpha-D-manno-heptose-7-phosphate kinase